MSMEERDFDIHQEILKLHDNEVPYFVPDGLNIEEMADDEIDQQIDGFLSLSLSLFLFLLPNPGISSTTLKV